MTHLENTPAPPQRCFGNVVYAPILCLMEGLCCFDEDRSHRLCGIHLGDCFLVGLDSKPQKRTVEGPPHLRNRIGQKLLLLQTIALFGRSGDVLAMSIPGSNVPFGARRIAKDALPGVRSDAKSGRY